MSNNSITSTALPLIEDHRTRCDISCLHRTITSPFAVPTDTVSYAAKIELGNQLFFDGRLSRNNQVSCAYCHIPGSGFSDPHPTSLGVDDLIGGRQAPTILNAAFSPLLFWDGRAKSLEEQTLGPIQNPIDMAETLDHLVLKLRTVKGYRRQFLNLFGTKVNPQGIAKAIAAFARTLVSTNSAFDQFSLGNKQAMNQATIRGMTLFKAEIERVCEGISEKRCQTLRFS